MLYAIAMGQTNIQTQLTAFPLFFTLPKMEAESFTKTTKYAYTVIG